MDGLLDQINSISYRTRSIPQISWRSNFKFPQFSETKLSSNYRLMIDKRFMPSSFITDSNEREQAWKNFAVGVACYAYKTVGEHFPKEFKILLANSAAVIVFSGLLAECETTQSLLKCKLNSFSEKNNIELQENNNELDKYAEYEPDGEWFYGSWTSDNLASVGEMESVIQQDISDFCAKLINITMESYYYTNRFYPPDITTYPREIISHKLMVKYGIYGEDSLRQLLHIIGHWISRRHYFSIVAKQTGCISDLIPVKLLCNRELYLSRNICNEFCDPPAGWIRTHLAYRIAEKLVRSDCIILFNNLYSLMKLKRRYDDRCKYAYHYHVDKNYLTGTLTSIEIDDGCNLLGQLITFLKYAEPNSSLFHNSYLKVNNETCEKYYDDYNKELDSLLKQRYSMNNQLSKKFLKNFLPNDSSFNVTLLIECWKLYNVNNNEIEKILVYFSSINYNRIRDRLNRN